MLVQRLVGNVGAWEITRTLIQERPDGLDRLLITLALPGGAPRRCPLCKTEGAAHDHRDRSWRALDAGPLETWIEAGVPRVRCPEHGVRVVEVPWARPRIGFTSSFEDRAVELMQTMSTRSVAISHRVTWEEAAGMRRRAESRNGKGATDDGHGADPDSSPGPPRSTGPDDGAIGPDEHRPTGP